jgi:hypothetical protein
MRLAVSAFLSVAASISSLNATDSVLNRSEELYGGWRQMYNLKFEDAHGTFGQWMQNHPADSLGPASDAAAYLFSELARLGALESELFVDDARFWERKKLLPDPQVRLHFVQQIDRADRLADLTLQTSSTDASALFVKCLTCGLRANYAGLIEKQNLTALSYTKKGRPYADKLLSVDPSAFDAYLGPGIGACALFAQTHGIESRPCKRDPRPSNDLPSWILLRTVRQALARGCGAARQ